MEPQLRVEHISKAYKSVQALSDVNFEVGKGELFGLIGPDGAGKTTLFRILTTLILADSGKATMNGWDVVKDYRKVRDNVGYMPGRFSLYQTMTVEENLSFFARLFHTTIDQNYDLVKDIYSQIEPFKDRMAGKLSGGMKQKLALSCALIHRPMVLFLDEPTTGIDPVSRKELWAMLRKLKEQDITIVVSTPYMDEAILCDRIGLIRKGQLLSVDTPQGIIRQFKLKTYAVKADDMISALEDLRKMKEVKSSFTFGEYHHVTFVADDSTQEGSPKPCENVLAALTAAGHSHIEIREIPPTIEDCFMNW